MLSLEKLKYHEKYLINKIKKYNDELKIIENKLNTFSKCSCCEQEYCSDQLRTLTIHEFDIIENSEKEIYDADSCYQMFDEDSLYCGECIKKRLNNNY